MTFSLPVRVYWEDTDAGGVVYHARYLAFLERARTEWLRERGFDQHHLQTVDDVVFVVRGMTLDFLAPARLDDVLRVTAVIESTKRASFVFEQRILRDNIELVTAHTRCACLNASSFRPCPLPDDVYKTLQK